MTTISIQVTEEELQKIINGLSLGYEKMIGQSRKEGDSSLMAEHYHSLAEKYNNLQIRFEDLLARPQ